MAVPLIVKGNLVDILSRIIRSVEVTVLNGKIEKLISVSKDASLPYILPGFIDSHVHIESSMLVPSEFAKLAVVHGTVATISDPHEIANVCGLAGVDFMIDNANTVPFKFNFGAPSCVPATIFETAGAELDSEAVAALLKRPEIKYLSEMMNFPGVLNNDTEVLKKIASAHSLDKPVDGHAPGLRGEMAKKYIEAGITTDHECFTAEEALDKLKFGMKILIREGSAAKNFEALADLLNDHYAEMMFCSDDKHPDSLVEGHINQLCARAVAKGIDVFKVLQAACINPVKHYKLDVGLLQQGDAADFIIAKDLTEFKILQTYINGVLVAENGRSLIETSTAEPINFFECTPVSVEDIRMQKSELPLINNYVPVIEALEGQLITNKLMIPLSSFNVEGQFINGNVSEDILKLVVVNRYKSSPVAKAFIRNFNLKEGAIASTVAHDSHNIIALGADDESITKAINLLIENKGGVSCVNGKEEKVLPLPVAGLMSNADGYKVAADYTAIDKMAKSLGSTLAAPYMTLSFMALLVIPHIKLSDKGLFDGDSFDFILSQQQ
ncbi:MAG: ade [Chitinophagaceae bacterium]|nr:ade [Chitinophagaceae bacterium]